MTFKMGRKNGWKLDGSKIVQKFFKNDIDWIFFLTAGSKDWFKNHRNLTKKEPKLVEILTMVE